MEATGLPVIYKKRAENSIFRTYTYISNRGYPDTAENFADRMYDFGDSLADFPDKYPVCRFPHLAKRGFHCAVFERDHIFVYRREGDAVVIHNVVNVKRMRR